MLSPSLFVCARVVTRNCVVAPCSLFRKGPRGRGRQQKWGSSLPAVLVFLGRADGFAPGGARSSIDLLARGPCGGAPDLFFLPTSTGRMVLFSTSPWRAREREETRALAATQIDTCPRPRD